MLLLYSHQNSHPFGYPKNISENLFWVHLSSDALHLYKGPVDCRYLLVVAAVQNGILKELENYKVKHLMSNYDLWMREENQYSQLHRTVELYPDL